MVFSHPTTLLLCLLLSSLALTDSIREPAAITADAEAIRWEKRLYGEAKYRGRRMGAVKENTGANPTVGKCVAVEQVHGGKGKKRIECRSSGFRISEPSNVKLFGKMPFSADYYSPKTHPPKHN